MDQKKFSSFHCTNCKKKSNHEDNRVQNTNILQQWSLHYRTALWKLKMFPSIVIMTMGLPEWIIEYRQHTHNIKMNELLASEKKISPFSVICSLSFSLFFFLWSYPVSFFSVILARQLSSYVRVRMTSQSGLFCIADNCYRIFLLLMKDGRYI